MKIGHKGILVISIPLLCEITFVATLFQLQDGLEAAANRESRSRDIVSTVNSILMHVNQLAANGALIDLLNDPDKKDAEIEGIRKEMERARGLMGYCPEQARNWRLLSSHAKLAVETMFSLRQALLEGPQALKGENKRDLKLSLGRLFQDLQAIKDEEERRHQAGKHDSETVARTRIKSALWWGVAVNLVLTVLLVGVFYREIGRKLASIVLTVRNIGEQKPLGEPLGGTDELAALDAVLHEMHSSLETARRKERALLDNATALICSLDRDLHILEVSNAAEVILGIAAVDLQGLSLERFVDAEQLQPVRRLQRETEPAFIEVELQVNKPDGTVLHFQWSICWSPPDSRFFCVALDVSQKKELEEMKRDFMSMVSHDLRTPLTALTIFLEMLGSGAWGALNQTAMSGLEKSRRSLHHLIELVNGLLDLEKIDSGRLELALQPVSLLSVLAETIEMLEPLCDANEIDMDVQVATDLMVLADQTRLLQVLQNLLSNAIKYSPAQSVIKITAVESEQNEQILISIVDQGPGIPAELQGAVFDRFKQLDTSIRKGIKGTGIGLAVCKSLIELHGGSIGVTSEQGRGSTFWFTLSRFRAGGN